MGGTIREYLRRRFNKVRIIGAPFAVLVLVAYHWLRSPLASDGGTWSLFRWVYRWSPRLSSSAFHARHAASRWVRWERDLPTVDG